MSGLYFLASIIAVGWLFYWSLMGERRPDRHRDMGPFAMRDGHEMAERHGDRNPF